jgi:hypothetical protein
VSSSPANATQQVCFVMAYTITDVETTLSAEEHMLAFLKGKIERFKLISFISVKVLTSNGEGVA